MEKTNKNRPKVLDGDTYQAKTGCGVMYTTINVKDDVIQEIFIRLGKAGGCAAAQNECIGRLASLATRKGATPEEIMNQLKGIRCNHEPSCGEAVAKTLKNYLEDTNESKKSA